MVDRLKEDHENARQLAVRLAEIKGIDINVDSQHTNMVYFNLQDSAASLDSFREKLALEGLLVGGGRSRIRMVTHAWVDLDDINNAIGVIKKALA